MLLAYEKCGYLCSCRYAYKTGTETVSQQLYNALTVIQMGRVEDKKGWTIEID